METYRVVLIVDDNTSLAEPLNPYLKDVFDLILIHTVPNQTAKDAFEHTEIDVMLFNMNCMKHKPAASTEEEQTDHHPDNGQEAIKWIRKIHRKYPETRIILLTSPEDVALAEKGVKSGAYDYVTMPWENTELERVLQKALDADEEREHQ